MVSKLDIMVPFLDIAAQYPEILDEVRQRIDEVIAGRQFILGPAVEQFESDFAAFCESSYALGLSSGTAAIHLALLACGVGPGDEVITTAHTFIATCWPITWVGARVVLVDVDPDTLTIDPARVAGAVTPRTKALIPVHLYGQSADMDPIVDIAQRHGLAVIEDACQAHGARYKGRRAGSIGDIACFSFYPGKNLGAFGEGGAVVTNNAKLAEDVARLRDHGQSRRYIHEVQGYNYRMDGIQGAVLGVKLRYLSEWNKRRRAHASYYDTLLAGCPGIRITTTRPENESVYHLYTIRARDRDELRAYLLERGIETGLHYPVPIHLQPAYADLGYREGDFPVCEDAAATLISLPLYAELSRDQVAHVAGTIQTFYN